MSVLIKGMEKPEHCGYCRFRYDGICHALQKTQYSMNECPLVVIDDAGLNDTISRQAAIDAIELITWYHQNRYGEMVEGANSQEHQAWYKEQDVYKALYDLPSVDGVAVVRCKDCDHWTNDDCPFTWGKAEDAFCSYAERREE